MNDGRTAGLSLGIHAIGAPGVSISGKTSTAPSRPTSARVSARRWPTNSPARSPRSPPSVFAKQQTAPDVEPAGNFGLLHVQAGARANLPLGGLATVPYVSASVGRRALGARVTDLDTGESYDSSLFGRHVRARRRRAALLLAVARLRRRCRARLREARRSRGGSGSSSEAPALAPRPGFSGCSSPAAERHSSASV